MTLNAPSFFAGIGTVVVLLVAGFGGGVLMSAMMTGDGPREPNKIERRAAEAAKPPTVASDPVPTVEDRKTEPVVQAVAAPPAAPQNAVPPAAPPAAQNAAPPTPQSRSPQANDPPPQIQAQQQPGVQPPAPPNPSQRPPGQDLQLGSQQPVALVQPPPQEQWLTRRQARAKAREVRRLEDQRRQAERRESAEARRQLLRQTRDARAGERSKQREADEDAREERRNERREEQPVFLPREGEGLFGPPRFRLFGGED